MRGEHHLYGEEKADLGFSLTQLRAFVTLAQTLSYGDAAAALGYSEPAVHHQVKRLQETLDCALFEKSGRSVSLTSEGRRLLPQCLAILKEASLLPRMAARQRDQDRLVVAAGLVTAAYTLPDVLVEVRRIAPSLKVDFGAYPRNEVLELVRHGDADVGIAHSLDQIADPDELKISRWRDIDYYLLESPTSDFGEEPTVFAVGQMMAPLGSVINRMASSRIVPRTVFLPSADAVRSMCIAGLGFGFLRKDCVEHELETGALRPATVLDTPSRSTIWAIQSKRGPASEIAERFLQLTETWSSAPALQASG